MELKKIEDRLSRLSTLVEGWRRVERVPRIERDMALEELRRVYDEILGSDTTDVAIIAEESAAEEGSAEPEEETSEPERETTESVADVGDAFDDALDIDALLGLDASDDEPKPEPAVVPEPAPAPAPEPEPAPAPAPEPEPAPVPVPVPKKGGGLFDIDDIPVRTKSSRKMIALYNTPSTPIEPKPEPRVQYNEPEAVEEAPAPVVTAAPTEVTPVEQPKRVADVLGGSVTVLGDAMAGDDTPTTPFNRIDDIRKAIGLNDKFLMIRDLFGGDEQKYEDTIDTLNEFEDLDECMIYIVENFRWNPDSEGAKLLVSLIERKLA